MEEVGFLVEKEEEEDGGDGVVVVGMVEEMEERKVGELVAEMAEMVAGQGGSTALALGLLLPFFVGCWWEGGGKMKEREKGSGVYI